MCSRRLQTIVVFCIAFSVIGWTAPIFYATYVPSGHYIDAVELEAGDTTIDAEEQTVCFTRDVKYSTAGVVINKMVLLQDDHREHISQNNVKTYFHAGHDTVKLTLDLPENLEPGEYQYLVAISFTVQNGFVERDVQIQSNTFTVHENGTTETVDC